MADANENYKLKISQLLTEFPFMLFQLFKISKTVNNNQLKITLKCQPLIGFAFILSKKFKTSKILNKKSHF